MITSLHLLAFALSLKYYSTKTLAFPKRVVPYRDAKVANVFKDALQ